MIAVLLALGLMNMFGEQGGLQIAQSNDRKLSYSEFRNEVEKGNVKSANWQLEEISGVLIDGKKYVAKVFDVNTIPAAGLIELLDKHHVSWQPKDPPMVAKLVNFLSMFTFPLVLFFLIYFLFIRPAQSGGNSALNFGRSRAKRMSEDTKKVTFADVAGIDEAKNELSEIVDFLKNTKKYGNLGAKIPRGILLTGLPGVGKTHLARAIAGEAGVPFFHISGSDFVEMFVGVGAARVRDLFETAKAQKPCLVFVDEIDAVGRQRGAGLGGGHDEREQTLNQLLVEMDGFDPNSGVILIAATNRPDVLDPALLRPGRFDRQIVVEPPDAIGREQILKIHAKDKKVDNDIKFDIIAKRTVGFTGADLANALNEAALMAARHGDKKIKMHHLEEALDRVIAGPQRKSRVLDGEEREIIAYHEAGHAIVGEVLDECHPVHKVTILPRGMSLGSTWSRPESDKYLVSKQELLDDICMTLGGRAAEDVVYNKIWTGASSDLQRVTRIARSMVCEYGMSEKLGTLALGKKDRSPFLGRDYNHDVRDYSEEVAKDIDKEVHSIVETCYNKTKKVLVDYRKQLDDLVKLLLEKETIDREEFLAVIGLPDRKTNIKQSADTKTLRTSELMEEKSVKKAKSKTDTEEISADGLSPETI